MATELSDFAQSGGVNPVSEYRVHCSRGERILRIGMRFRDGLSGSTWEVVEPDGGRIYSPSGFGGTPTFWCKPIELPESAKNLLAYARDDGCVSFCGDSIAATLIDEARVNPNVSEQMEATSERGNK